MIDAGCWYSTIAPDRAEGLRKEEDDRDKGTDDKNDKEPEYRTPAKVLVEETSEDRASNSTSDPVRG